jgi:hypothetical protein
MFVFIVSCFFLIRRALWRSTFEHTVSCFDSRKKHLHQTIILRLISLRRLVIR